MDITRRNNKVITLRAETLTQHEVVAHECDNSASNMAAISSSSSLGVER